MSPHTLCKDNIRAKRCCELAASIGLLPRVVVKATFNIATVDIAVEPDIYNGSVFVTTLIHASAIKLTWHDDVTVVSDQILKDFVWAVLNIHVAPVNPAVLGL